MQIVCYGEHLRVICFCNTLELLDVGTEVNDSLRLNKMTRQQQYEGHKHISGMYSRYNYSTGIQEAQEFTKKDAKESGEAQLSILEGDN